MRTKLTHVRKLPRCTTCGQKIPRSQPYVSLTHHKAAGVLYFHERERCALDAFRALVAGDPGKWILTHFRVHAEAN